MRALSQDDGPPTSPATQFGLLDTAFPPKAPWLSPAIVLSRRAARPRQRDDPIALPSTWVVARIAGRAE
jgi:hypothetical protein